MSDSDSGDVRKPGGGAGPTPARQLTDYFYLVLERFWIVLIVTVIALVYARHKISKMPDLYEATATIEVMREAKAVADLAEGQAFRAWNPQDRINTMIDKLGMLSLFEEIAKDESYEDLVRQAAGSAADPEALQQLRGRAAEVMREAASAKGRNRSLLIDLTAVHTDPEFAREVLVAMLEKYADLNFTARADQSRDNIKLLLDHLEKMKASLADIVLYDEALRIRDDIRLAEDEILEMEKKYLPKWPPLIQAQERLGRLQENFRREINRISQTSESESEFWATVNERIAALPPEDQIASQIQTAEGRHRVLSEEYQTLTNFAKDLRSQAERGGLAQQFDKSEFRIVQPPVAKDYPFSPIPTKEYTRYGVIGFAGGLLLAFFLGFLDGTVRRIEDLEQIAGVPVLATIQRSRRLRHKRNAKTKIGEASALLVNSGEDSGKIAESFQLAEAFQSLRVGLASGDGAKRKTLIVTSALPEEGKSVISVNTAAAFASGGQKTLIVDLDFRKPRVHHYLGLDPNHKGVTDALDNPDLLDEAIRSSSVDRLDVLSGGTISFTPSLIADEEKFSALIGNLESRYDRIILDTAPVLAVSDTMVIAPHADGICLVFRMWKSPRRALVRALQQLGNNDAYPIGVIANFMPRKKGLGQYGYYYSYTSGGYYAYGKA